MSIRQTSDTTVAAAKAGFSAATGYRIEEIRDYRLYLVARCGLKATSINPIVGALRFFYGVTLDKKQIAEEIPFARKEDTLPAVLTREDVVRLAGSGSCRPLRPRRSTIVPSTFQRVHVIEPPPA